MARELARMVAVLTCAALISSTAACGGSDPNSKKAPKAKPSPSASPSPTSPAFAREPAGVIVSTGLQAMRFVGQVRFSGNMIEDGERLDMNVRKDSRGNCSGSVSQSGATTYFIATRNASYVKGNAKFWRDNAGDNAGRALAYLDGRWAKAKASKEIADLCDLGRLLSGRAFKSGTEVVGSRATVSSVSSFEHHEVVEVTGHDGKDTYRFLVEVAEPHRIFRLTSDTPSDPGELVFEFDDDRLVDVPGPTEAVAFGG